MIHELEIKKLSIRHLNIIRNCCATYGELLATRYECLSRIPDKKDLSILQELVFDIEKHYSLRKMFKEENPPKANKKVKLKIHTAMVLEDALQWYQKNRESVFEIPYLEELKEKLNKELL